MDEIRVTRQVVVPVDEVTWRFSGSGGPGGQHANTANTRVEVIFDLAASSSIPSLLKSRMVARLGDVVRVVASDERSQWQNRRLALLRLQALLAGATVVPKRRVATRPSYGSTQRRLEEKRQASGRKAARRRPTQDD